MCPEKQSLIERYDVAARTYSDAVGRMHETGAEGPLAEFSVLYGVATRANEACESAHESLRRHIEDHGC